MKRFDVAELQQDCSNSYLRKCLLGVFGEGAIRKANVLLSELNYIQLYRNFDAENENVCLSNSVIFLPKNVQDASYYLSELVKNGYANREGKLFYIKSN